MLVSKYLIFPKKESGKNKWKDKSYWASTSHCIKKASQGYPLQNYLYPKALQRIVHITEQIITDHTVPCHEEQAISLAKEVLRKKYWTLMCSLPSWTMPVMSASWQKGSITKDEAWTLHCQSFGISFVGIMGSSQDIFNDCCLKLYICEENYFDQDGM